MNTFNQKLQLLLVTAFVVAACGGGGGGGGNATAGIDRLGVSTGTVTGFGSIFVNGVKFETETAEFEIDDDSVGSSEDDLDVGDVVIVTFDPDVPGNVANIVFSEEAVEGPIESFNTVIRDVTCNIVVVGQCVLVDGATSFDDSISPASLAGLTVGDFIEVSGLFDSNGDIRATRIELKPAGGEVEVHGKVSMITGSTFKINALTVDYVSVPAIIDDDFPGMMFSAGDLVEVKGINFSPGGALLATKVEPDGLEAIGVDPDDFDEVEVEIEGFITRFVSPTDFDVAGFPVTTTGGTVFEGGSADDLALNVKVEVEGDLDGANVIVADKVDIRRSNNLRVTALVDAVDPELVALGITIQVDALTRLEDKSDADKEPFSVDDIAVGNYVEVRGGAVPGSTDILASRLEREDIPDPPGSDTELRGFVEEVTPPTFKVAGVTIVTNGGTTFVGVGGVAGLEAGDLVDVDGTASGTILTADEVTLEN